MKADGGGSEKKREESRALVWLLIAVSLAFAWVLLPFYGTVLWASIIALLFSPLQRALMARFHGRRTASALVTLLAVLLIVIVPLVLITLSLTREAAGLYQRIQSGELDPGRLFQQVYSVLPGWITTQLERAGLVDFPALQKRLTASLSQGSQFIAAQALAIGQNAFEFVAALFVTLYLAFFLIRDGDSLARTIQRAIPLAPEHKAELMEKFTTVIRATVKGNVLVAAIQGALGGLAFWYLDVSGPLLWAVLMAFLSLLPAVGAALVWAPVAIYLLATGALWQGVGLVAWGVLVIGLVDNVLRPILVGKDTRMPDYVVLISTLGGMALIGINGFVLGPAIAAMFMAVWHIHLATRIVPRP
jgi:predicted PurR-regulated permease PerM